MSDALLLLPDFLLIACGFVLCRWTALNRPVWEAVERLVYHLLFPVLLFHAIVRSPLEFASTVPLAASGALICVAGFGLAWALKWLPGTDARLHASGAQVAFRFNSYVALALAGQLGGEQGVAWIALLIALGVPLCNFGAVYPLARHGGLGFWREVLRNPLILATLGGLLANLLGLRLVDPLATVMGRIGQAALPLGLMAVGAGLKLGGLKEGPRLAAGLLSIRHLALPLIALALVHLLPVPPAQRPIIVAFAAMPTASSAYVLAVRMGGSGPYVAGLVTVSTLLGMASIPLWLAVLRAL